MDDDHGTLRGPDGEPLAYRVLDPDGLPNIPLIEAKIWPDDMGDGEARRMAARIEEMASRLLDLTLCPGDHSATLPCPDCGAAV